MDLGPPRQIDPSDEAHTDTKAAGTPNYISPEQVLEHRADARSDIYFLGCTLFHLLTGKAPFSRGEPKKTVRAHIEDPIPSACEITPSLAPAIDNLLKGMMEKRPEDRYQSLGVWLEDISILRSNLQDNAQEPIRHSTSIMGPEAGRAASNYNASVKLKQKRTNQLWWHQQWHQTLHCEKSQQQARQTKYS